MDIFTGELATFLKRLEAVPPAQLLQEVQAALLNWIDLAADVQGNTSAAVDVLNDMLQYDKVRGGSLMTAVHLHTVLMSLTLSPTHHRTHCTH
jgi:hypothetical protein